MTSNLFDLTGKVALVTGGSKGLGKAMARGLALAGADIAICSRSEAELKPALEEILAGTGRKGKSLSDGDPLKCELAQPHGVAVHPKTGDIYIADSSNNRIVKIEQ